MKKLVSLRVAFLAIACIWSSARDCYSQALVQNDSAAMQPLFNGKDLTGWVYVNTPTDTWSVQDGMLVCTGKPIGEIRTEKMYQNFVLELEWRHMVPKGNAGVFVWADDITSKGVPFHRGVEVQVLENAYGNTNSHTTHGDIFPIHGAKMTPINGRGGSRAFPTEERSKPSPEWNHYRIECNNGAISLAVNGKVVTRGSDASPRKGYICIESEGGVVHYRNIRIQTLPDSPVDEEHVAVANRGYRSIYSGLDLRGWKVTPEGTKAWKSNDWVLAFDGSVDTARSNLSYSMPGQAAWKGLVVDFRFKNDTQSLSIQLPGAKEPLALPADLKKLNGSPIGDRNNWSRLEATHADGVWHVVINKQSLQIPCEKPVGDLSIQASGPLDLANLYAR